MTDRIKGLTIILDRDYRDDDVSRIVEAIQMIRGVTGVKLHISTAEDVFLRDRLESDVRRQLFDFSREFKFKGKE